MEKNIESDLSLVQRLRKRAEIRRQIPNRKSVENNEPDKIADLIEESADAIEMWRSKYREMHNLATQAMMRVNELEKKASEK
jgi:hypothetical protein